MADSTAIQKVYEIKSIGGQETYRTLDGINKMFIEMKNNKQALGTININIDTSRLEGVTKSFDSILDSNKELIAEIKILAIEMGKLGQIGQQMATAISTSMNKTRMATAENIIGFSKVTATIGAGGKTIVDYDRSIGLLGERLADLRTQAAYTASQIGILNKDIAEGKGDIEANITYLGRLTTTQQQLKTEITEVTGAMTAMNKVYNPALIDSETAALAANKVELLQRNQLLKLNAVAQSAQDGSIKEARAQAALYRNELQNLNLTTEEGVIEQKKLIAAIDELDAFINANSEAYTRRKINIGNYPELTIQAQELKTKMDELTASGQTETEVFKELEVEALKVAAAMKSVNSPSGGANANGIASTSQQLSALKVNMAGLVSAGKEETAEFKQMQLEAQRLTAVLNEVNTSIKSATTVGDKFASTIERMGIRMIANMLIFQTALELGQYLFDKWTKISDAEQAAKERLDDYNNSLEEFQKIIEAMPSAIASGISIDSENENNLVNIMSDQTQSIEARTDAYTKLLGVMPGLFHGLTKEQALTEENAISIKNHAAAIVTLKNNITETTKARDAAIKLLEQTKDSETALERTYGGTINDVNPEKTKRLKDQTQAVSDYNKSLSAMQAQMARINSPEIKDKKGKSPKEPHDYTNAILEAQKRLNDEMAKILFDRLTLEMNEQKEIFDNTERSLAQRLSAYSIYSRDLKEIIKLQSDAEIKNVQDRLNKITEIEQAVANKKAGVSYNKGFFDKSGALKPEEQTLLINKEALSKQIDVIVADTAVKTQQAETTINRDIASITKSSMDKMLEDISNDTSRMIAEVENRANAARDKVYNGKGRDIIKDKKVNKIGLQENIDKDNVNIDANTKEQQQLQSMIDEEKKQVGHNAKMEELEQQHLHKLQDLKNKAVALQTQLQSDTHRKEESEEEDSKKLNEILKQQSIDAFEQIGAAYVQMLEQQSAANQKHAQEQLDWGKKLVDSQVQSNQQKQATDKAYYLAQQQLEKQRLEDQRRIAKVQMAIDFATTVVKIIASNADLGLAAPAADAIMIAGATAVYLAKLAMMNSQQFGAGGDVPGNGGMFGGNSHSTGGTPFVFQNRAFTAEADELAIINKRSSSSNQRMNVSGTPKQIASAINSFGGGVDFSPGAQMYRFEYGGSLGAQIQPPSFIADHYTRAAMNGSGYSDQSDMYTALMAHVEAMNGRMDRLTVHLNHTELSSEQNRYSKAVKVGEL